MTNPSDTPHRIQIHESRGVDQAEDGRPVLVLLHGRGSNERDLLGLYPYLKDHQSLGTTGSLGAPPALVTPRAPYEGMRWGYGPGWAWYRYEAEDRVDVETLEGSLAALDEFFDRLPDILGVEPGPIVLGGFSQGGTMSLAWALTRPGRVRGVLNLSGFLVQAPAVDEALAGGARDLNVFWGHGRADPNIPFALGEKGRDRLQREGAELETFDHPSGHTITPGELSALGDWLAEVLSDESSG